QIGVDKVATAALGAGAIRGLGVGARRGSLAAGCGAAASAGSGGPGTTTTGATREARAIRALEGARDWAGPAGTSRSAVVEGAFWRGGALARTSAGFAALSGSGITGDSVRGEAGRRGKGSGTQYVSVLL